MELVSFFPQRLPSQEDWIQTPSPLPLTPGTSFFSSLGLGLAHLQKGASGQPVLCFC